MTQRNVDASLGERHSLQPTTGPTPRQAAGKTLPWLLAAVAIALLGAVLASRPTEVLVQGFFSGLMLGGLFGLIAMGLALIFGVLGVVNFAHGALLAIGMYTSYVLVDNFGLNPYMAAPVAGLVLFGLGALVQDKMLKRTLFYPIENQLLLTVGLSILCENGLLMIFSPTPRSINASSLEKSVQVFGAHVSLAQITTFTVALVVAMLLWLLLTKTMLGTAIRGVAQNSKAATIVGINSRRIYWVTFGMGSACAGIAGALLLPLRAIEPYTGESFTIIAFVTVVLGGLQSVSGAMFAGLLVGLIHELSGILVPSQDKMVLVFLLFVACLLLRPQGLFSRVS